MDLKTAKSTIGNYFQSPEGQQFYQRNAPQLKNNYDWELTNNQQKLEEFKNHIKRNNISLPQRLQADNALGRYIRTNDPIESSIDSLTSNIQNYESTTQSTPELLNFIRQGYAYLAGRDKLFFPTLVIKLEAKHFKDENFKRNVLHAIFFLGKFLVENYLNEKQCDCWNILLDANNESVLSFPFAVIGEIAKQASYLFPSRLNKIFILHPSTSLKFSWKLILQFLTKEQEKKLIMIDKNKEIDILSNYYNMDQIEQSFGGELANLNQFWPPQNTITAEYLQKHYQITNIHDNSHSNNQANSFQNDTNMNDFHNGNNHNKSNQLSKTVPISNTQESIQNQPYQFKESYSPFNNNSKINTYPFNSTDNYFNGNPINQNFNSYNKSSTWVNGNHHNGHHHKKQNFFNGKPTQYFYNTHNNKNQNSITNVYQGSNGKTSVNIFDYKLNSSLLPQDQQLNNNYHRKESIKEFLIHNKKNGTNYEIDESYQMSSKNSGMCGICFSSGKTKSQKQQSDQNSQAYCLII